MSGFDHRPRIKDADFYIDAIQDLVDKKLGDATAPVIMYLHDEEQAAEANGEHAVSGCLRRMRMHLIHETP